MIKQTWLGWIACRLGFHLLVWGQFNTCVDNYRPGFSLSGGCVRCNKGIGWDV